MEPIKAEFIEKFKLNTLAIKIVGTWVISLRPQQPTIGSLVLTLNRYCASLANLTSKESEELGVAFKEIERILKLAFDVDKVNYLALMMVDEQVHFHVIPRYQNVRNFDNVDYIDKAWPGVPVLDPIDIHESTLINLKQFLKNISE